ncbi:MAG: hypothetical protein V4760_13845, partial [Bdellovibrionota bacterium]
MKPNWRILVSTLAITLSGQLTSATTEPDWSREVAIPSNGRANPYELAPLELEATIRHGRLHALNYPVDVTGILLPYEPVRRVIERDTDNPILKIIDSIFGKVTGIKSFDSFEKRFGLLTYPETEGEGPYFVPFEDGLRPEHRMGFTSVETELGRAITVSCAQCHSANLFGRRVIGLTNRFTRANEMFMNALKVTPHVSPSLFASATEATLDETALYRRSRNSLAFVDGKMPEQLGLDTSLAQVALSLAKRDADAWATKSKPRDRYEALKRYVADSKPAVWWNVKYKNRWLADGSVVSGNPIYTNFIWNEIGRGTDLRDLDRWFDENPKVIEELTTAVFAAEPPRFTDFFPTSTIPLESAKRGQKIFETSCAGCHGHYEKAWDLPNTNTLPLAHQLATLKVDYRTKVVKVGTDPQRAIGMRSLAKLNDLEISKKHGIVIEVTEGYVPPPLVGIWARWPYFHNNAAPSLCAVLTPAKERPKKYWAREANDPATDFDLECNGYPSEKPAGAKREMQFDATKLGLK